VNLVLSIADAYAAGDYSATPNGSTSSTTFTPSYGDSVYGGKSGGAGGYKGSRAPKPQQGETQQPSSGSSGGSTTDGGSTPVVPGGGGGTGSGSDPIDKVKDAGDDVTDTVTNTLTPLQKAQNWCQANLSGAELDAVGGLSACANAYLEGGASAVNNLLAGLTDTVGGLLGG
jgi:hypothetical protein